MTTDPVSGTDDSSATTAASDAGAQAAPREQRVTRASAAWVAVAVALVLLILLIVFILENSTKVAVEFLGLSGTIPLGMALLIAAVGGGVVVAIAGVARITQLRMKARGVRRRSVAH